MSDLISRGALMRHIENEYREWGEEYDALQILGDIEDAPTIETERRKPARWLKTGQSLVSPERFRNYFCSECGYELDKSIRTELRYCPNCGAEMGE